MSLTRRALWTGGASAVAVLAIWTTFILVTRYAASRTLTPFDIAFVRYVFSGAVVLPLAWAHRAALARALGRDRREALIRAGALTATAGIGYTLLAYSGFFFAPAAHAAVLLPGTLPLSTALFAALLLHEPIGRRRWAGLGLIVAGDLLVGGHGLLQAGGGAWKGDLMFFTASAFWAVYAVLCRKWRLDAVPATAAIALGCLASYVPLYALGVVAGAIPSRLAVAPWSEIVLQAVYQGGITMLVAGIAFTHAVKTFGAVRTTMVTAMVPALAAVAAVPLLDEPLTTLTAAGLVCVTAGLLVGLRAALRPAPVALTRTAS